MCTTLACTGALPGGKQHLANYTAIIGCAQDPNQISADCANRYANANLKGRLYGVAAGKWLRKVALSAASDSTASELKVRVDETPIYILRFRAKDGPSAEQYLLHCIVPTSQMTPGEAKAMTVGKVYNIRGTLMDSSEIRTDYNRYDFVGLSACNVSLAAEQ